MLVIITYLHTYLLQLNFHSMAVVLTVVQIKQIRINIHKRNNTKTQYKQYKNTININGMISEPEGLSSLRESYSSAALYTISLICHNSVTTQNLLFFRRYV